jgi:hypothetical protein
MVSQDVLFSWQNFHAFALTRYAHVAGVWVGIHRDPQTLVETLRAMRRQVDISTEVGVVHDIRLQVRLGFFTPTV